MNYTDFFIFVFKYTPFWAVPMAMLSVHFAYIYWLKDYREIAYFWAFGIFFNSGAILAYFILGGPDRIVPTVMHILGRA